MQQQQPKIDHYWTDSCFEEGYFTFPRLYSEIVKLFSDDCHFVEVGSWKGRSSAYMAVEIHNSGKKIKFDCVDTWMGSVTEDGHQNDTYVKNGNLYEKFLSNIKPVSHVITPVREDSVKAANLYEDGSLDFVFIDADHRYDSVVADIKAWLPKLKNLGVLAGHDYGWCSDVRRAVHDTIGVGEGKYEDQYGVGFSSYDDGFGEGCWVYQVEKIGE